MALLTETADLDALVAQRATDPFVCIDTEFMRESTFWPRLCLIQLAGPGGDAVAIDPLAPGLSLEPLIKLLDNPAVVKVFHAARQDIEIFFQMTGRVPTPIFDTQVAAMVCGFGEAASYETLARRLARARIDKSSRFTDWSKRPLTDRQIAYALADVEHLGPIYTKLARRLESSGRSEWVQEEMAVLSAPSSYTTAPENAWQRIKTRNSNTRFLAILREVAAVRERMAQERDQPRNRILREEALIEIASHMPDNVEALARTRGLPRSIAHGKLGAALLGAVAIGQAVPEEDCPRAVRLNNGNRAAGPIVDLLKVLLKLRCQQHDVAQKLVSNANDLERLAAGERSEINALQGWRREIFGADAIALIEGRLALTGKNGNIAEIGI